MSTSAELEERLARLDARIGAVEARLGQWQAPPPPPYPWPQQYPPHQQQYPQHPQYARYPQPGVGAPPRPPRDWSRLPVWAGAGVTFVGVVLLLVLAASAFGPLARVLTGAGLGVALVGLAGWLVRRRGTGAGPSALAGTGITALLSSVVAATSLYRLVPAPVGLVLCLAVAAGGIALADRWDRGRLALAVLVGAELALMVVAGDLDALSLGLALVLQLGVAPTALRRVPVLAAVAGGATALHALVAGPVLPWEPDAVARPGLFAVGALAFVLGLGVALRLRGAPVPAAVGLAFAPLPLLTTMPAVGVAPGVAVTLAAAATTAAAALLLSADRVVRATAVSVAALLVAAATARLADGVTLAGLLLAEALVLLAVAAWTRSRPAQLAGAWFAVLGGVGALGTALSPDAVFDPLRPGTDVSAGALVAAGLLVATAVVALVAALRTGIPAAAHWVAWAWLPVAAGLYGASWLVVTVAQLVVPGPGGFLGGHVLVTIGVTVLGVGLLARGPQRPVTTRTGFALVVAALVKLVLFDLVTLDGLARVTAFIGAGLVLLAVGTWYANRVAGGDRPASPAPTTGSPAATGDSAAAEDAP